MMRFVLLLAFGLMMVGGSAAQAQQTYICVKTATGCVIVDSTHPLPVTGSSSTPIPVVPTAEPTTNSSGTITVGGTFQTIAAANTARLSFEFVNLCNVTSACTATTNYCYLFFATSGSPSKTTNVIPIPPGGS